jgi:hypothetical protein
MTVSAPGSVWPPTDGMSRQELDENCQFFARQSVAEPLADAAPELLVFRAGPAPAPPQRPTRGPTGGLQARRSFVSGQRMSAARRLSLSSICFVRGHTWWSPPSRPQSQLLGAATGPPSPSQQPVHQLSPATSSGHDCHASAHRRGLAAGDLLAIRSWMGERRPQPGAAVRGSCLLSAGPLDVGRTSSDRLSCKLTGL